MADLASLTLEIKSEQAAQAAQQLAELQRQGQAAERGAQSLGRQFDTTERAASGLERTYRRVRDELATLTQAQQDVDRQASKATTGTLNLSNAVQQAATQFERFGVVDLDPIRDEISATEERLAEMQKEALNAGQGVQDLDTSSLDQLEEEVDLVRDAFDRLEKQAATSGDEIQRQAADIIRAYNIVGQRISQPFEQGVDLPFQDRVEQVEREANRRRELASAVEAQLQELGRLGDVEQAELARAGELTTLYEQQSLARLRDAEAARAQAEASKPRLSAQFESGVDLHTEEKLQQVELEAQRRSNLIGIIEGQLSASGRLGVEEEAELSRARDLTGRFLVQSQARIHDAEAGEHQGHANEELGHTYGHLLEHVKQLALAYVAFVSAHEAAEAVLNFGAAESSLRGIVNETTKGAEQQVATFQKLSNEAKELGLTTQFSGDKIEAGFKQMITAGNDAEDAIAGTRAAMALAEAHAIPLSQAVDLVSRSLKQLDADGTQAERITDALSNVAIRTQGDITQLAFSFNQVAPSSRAANLELEEVVATLGVLSQLRGRGQQGPLVFKELIESLINPSKEARAALEDLKIPLAELDPRTNKLVDVLHTLREANLSSAQTTKIFGESVSLTIPFLVNQVDKIDELIKAQKEGIGVTERLAEANSDNLRGSLEQLESAFTTFIGSSQGLAGELRHVADAGADTIRILAGEESQVKESSAGTQAFATALRALVSPVSLVTVGVTALAAIWRAYQVAVLGAKFETIGIFGLMAAHPFVTVGVALTALTAIFYAFNSRVEDAREELKKLGDAADVTRIQEFGRRIEELSASFARASEQGKLSRQSDAAKALLEEFEARADQLAAQSDKFGIKARVEVLDPEKDFDLQRALKSVEKSLGLKARVEFETQVLDREARDVGDRMRDQIIGRLRIKGGLEPDELNQGFLQQDRGHQEKFLRDVVPQGVLDVGKVTEEGAQQLFRSLTEVEDKFGKQLSDAWNSGNKEALATIVASINDELDPILQNFLSGQELISVGADNLRRAVEGSITPLEEKVTELDKRAEEIKKAATSGATDPAAQQQLEDEADRRKDARKELEQYLLAKREELSRLQATVGLTGLAAAHYEELAKFQKLVGDSGGEVTEKQKEFRLETERLLKLLQDGFKDPAAFEQFQDQFNKLLLTIEEFKLAKDSADTRTSTDVAGGGRGTARSSGLEDTTHARLLEADAVLGQDEAVQAFLKNLRQERQDLQATIGLTDAQAESVLKLSQVERVLSDSTALSTGARAEYLKLAEEEIQRIRETREQQEELARSRGEERSALDDTIDSRLAELEAFASGRRSIKEFLDSLEEERSLRERSIGLSDEEAQALRQLSQLERLLAGTIGLTDDERKNAIDTARRQLAAMLQLGNAQKFAADEESKREDTRQQAGRALAQQEEENAALQDAIDLLHTKTDREREDIEINASRRGLKPYQETLDSLEELLQKLDAAIKRAIGLRTELGRQTFQQNQLVRGILSQEDSRTSIEEDISLIEAKSEAERRSITLTKLEHKERFTQAELEKKDLSELKDLYLDLATAIERANTRRTISTARKDLQEEIKLLKSTPQEAETRQRLRGLSDDEIEKHKGDIEDLVKQADTIRDFRQVGQEIARSFTEAFDQIAFQGAKLEDVLKGVAQRVLQAFENVFISKPLENWLSTLFAGIGAGVSGSGGTSGFTGFEGLPQQALGGVWSHGQSVQGFARGMAFGDEPGMAEPMPAIVRAFARGQEFTWEHPNVDTTPSISSSQLESATNPWGSTRAYASGNPFLNRIVDEPTVAPMALFGEAGPEAIVPLRSRGGSLGVSAFGGDGTEEVAPLRRGSGGRLGVDLDRLLDRVAHRPERIKKQLKQQVEAFATGDVFELGGMPSWTRHVLPAPQPLALGGAVDLMRPTGQLSLPQPYAVVQPTTNNTTTHDNSGDSFSWVNHFNFPAGTKPDDGFKRTVRQQEQTARERLQKR